MNAVTILSRKREEKEAKKANKLFVAILTAMANSEQLRKKVMT